MPVYKNETSTTIVEKFQDENGSDIIYRIDPGKAIKTEYVLTDANLTVIDPAPYFNPLQESTHTVTSTGSGDDQTISINLITKKLSIVNQSGAVVIAFLRSTDNVPGIYCYSGTERVILVGHNVDQVIFQFSEAGTVYVEERK